MKTTILCACVKDNRPDRNCDLGCGGSGVLCSRCLDKPGRWLDDRCPDCDGYTPVPVSAPSPEAAEMAERHNRAWKLEGASFSEIDAPRRA